MSRVADSCSKSSACDAVTLGAKAANVSIMELAKTLSIVSLAKVTAASRSRTSVVITPLDRLVLVASAPRSNDSLVMVLLRFDVDEAPAAVSMLLSDLSRAVVVIAVTLTG